MVSLAYVAGLFDGEGSISIAETERRGRLYHKLKVRITNTNRDALEACRVRLGCGVIHTRMGTNKKVYDLDIQTAEAAKTLKRLKPYLIIKQEPLHWAERFLLTIRDTKRGGKRERLSYATIRLRSVIRDRLMEVNS